MWDCTALYLVSVRQDKKSYRLCKININSLEQVLVLLRYPIMAVCLQCKFGWDCFIIFVLTSICHGSLLIKSIHLPDAFTGQLSLEVCVFSIYRYGVCSQWCILQWKLYGFLATYCAAGALAKTWRIPSMWYYSLPGAVKLDFLMHR